MIWFKSPSTVKEVELTNQNQTDLPQELQDPQGLTNHSRFLTPESTCFIAKLNPQSLPWQALHVNLTFQSLSQQGLHANADIFTQFCVNDCEI